MRNSPQKPNVYAKKRGPRKMICKKIWGTDGSDNTLRQNAAREEGWRHTPCPTKKYGAVEMLHHRVLPLELRATTLRNEHPLRKKSRTTKCVEISFKFGGNFFRSHAPSELPPYWRGGKTTENPTYFKAEKKNIILPTGYEQAVFLVWFVKAK